MESHLELLDWLIVAGYFVLVFAIAFWAARRERVQESTEGYFLAGRHMGWFVIGASLFAANIGSEHLVGLAGTGAASGVAVGQFEVLASLILMLLAWVFTPFYLRSAVYTMPEFLERRYSPAARWYLSLVSIIAYVLTKISVTIYAGVVVFESLMGIDFWTSALTVVITTGIYTILGGLIAVVYTDMIQMFVLIAGSVAITTIGLLKLGGIGPMIDLAGPGFFDMWKPASDPDFPWTGILFGAPILGIWYWCTDQFIVQRVLAARNIDEAQAGSIFAGYLKILPLFLFVMPGVIAYALAQSGQITLAAPDQAFPTLVRELLPTGLRGLVMAGMLAALMSSLSAVINSCSTLITWDVYKKLRPETSDKQLVRFGQWATAGLVLLGILWIPLMKNISDQIFTYLQSVQAYISPPIAAVFLLGVFWKRINSQGAMASLLTGFVLGMARLVLELNKASLDPNGLLFGFADINFLHFALMLFVICAIVLMVVSLVTPAPDEQKLAGLTYATAHLTRGDEAVVTPNPAFRRRNVLLSAGLVGLVLLIWFVFSN